MRRSCAKDTAQRPGLEASLVPCSITPSTTARPFYAPAGHLDPPQWSLARPAHTPPVSGRLGCWVGPAVRRYMQR